MWFGKKVNIMWRGIWTPPFPALEKPAKKRWNVCRRRWNCILKTRPFPKLIKWSGRIWFRPVLNMPKPVQLNLILKVLKEKGFFFIRQKGSHARFRKIGNPTRNVTVKMADKEIPYGTFQSILLQSGLREEDFSGWWIYGGRIYRQNCIDLY